MSVRSKIVDPVNPPRPIIALALVALVLLAACAAEAPAPPIPAPPQPAPGPIGLIERVATDRAMYAPGAPVAIAVELRNRGAASFSGDIALSFAHLGDGAAPDQAQSVASLAPGAATTLTFTWAPPAADFQGYRVEARARDKSGATLDTAATAVDVSSDWRKFPRYGFVSRYEAGLDADATIARMNDFHLNGVQFYDWQWQHHRPYSPEATWRDIANRPVARASVAGLIDAAHRRGMVAMNYNLAYGGYDGYWRDGSGANVEWGLFKRASGPPDPSAQDFHPLPGGWATGKLYLFDPASPDWRRYIFEQERQVFEHFAFDGWHVDTLGKRSLLWNAGGQNVVLPDALADFAGAARAALGKRIVLNTVGGYGQDAVAARPEVDFVYSELWEGDGVSTYADVDALAARAARSGKAIVMPAYMNRDYAEHTPPGQTRFFREPSVRLADAAIFAAGASHLELGDGDGMLSKEYFPSQPLVMSDSLRLAMRDYYDFLVAYENLLRDGTTGDDRQVAIDGVKTSARGQAGAVWTLAKRRPGYAILHLINLTGNRLPLWRDAGAFYPVPPPLTNLAVKMYLPAAPRAGARLWLASPDADHGRASALAYTVGNDAGGPFVAFAVPRLTYWDMLWLEQ